MERREEVKIKSGAEFDHLFPKAMLMTITKKEGATVADTIRFIPQVVRETLFHTNKIAKVLKRDTVYETCKAIWHFVYDHIAYRKDEDGKEQIRSPARAWHDRKYGVDCDCYTVFISSILSNLKIKHVLRITKYKEDHFQHIYPIVPLTDGSYITIDCVVRSFDYEEPYSEKKDTKMDLEYLNGVNDSSNKNIDAVELIGIYDDREAMAELGRIFKRKSGGSGEGGGKKKGKLKEVLKKGLHLTNILNPATATLRAGILASAKMNVFKIASRLKWAYLSDEEAQKRGIDMTKFARLKKIREKLENIFYGAGGKPENLKKAILKGRGNRNHEVSGLGYTPDMMDGVNEYSPISTLLGADIYESELAPAMNGIGELGEPATAATIAAASGIIGAIAGLLKSVGNIFPKKDKASKDFEEGGAGSSDAGGDAGGGGDAGSGSAGSSSDAGASDSGADSSSSSDGNNKVALKKTSTPAAKESSADDNSSGSDDNTSSNAKSKSAGDSTDNGDGTKPGFWENNKKWIKPVGIGVGALGLLYAGYRMVTGSKKETVKPALSGVPKSTKQKKKKGGKKPNVKSKKQQKKAVELL